MSETLDGVSRERQEALKEIVKNLHEGSEIKSVQKRFADLIRNVSPQEIAAMEQALIAEGVPVEQVQKVCDVHVEVFQSTLARQKKMKALPGHPVHTFIEENKVASRICRSMRRILKRLSDGGKVKEFEESFAELRHVEIHYQRKENQLFPLLERVNFTGPSSVMWGKHDEIRQSIRDLESALNNQDWQNCRKMGRSLTGAVKRMIFMEEKILFPTALRLLPDEQWVEIRNGEREIGYAWIQPGNLWDPSVVTATKEHPTDIKETGELPLDVGRLDAWQINSMLKKLPVDITYVDAQDTVRYYSQGMERIFPRSPAVVGRQVQNCHPPKSVHIVEKILQSFRSREKDVAEFWLTLNERFIHIRYFPMYSEAGEYRGVIEVSQDVTDIRSLKGEKRLLDW